MRSNFNESRVLAVLSMSKPKSNFERIKLSYAQLKSLVLLELVDPSDAQNDSPSIKEFLDFCEDCQTSEEEVIFEGYIVLGDRPDKRVSIEGLELMAELASIKTKKEFFTRFRAADEFDVDSERGIMRAWWD